MKSISFFTSRFTLGFRWLLLAWLLFFAYLMFDITIPYLLPPFPTNIDFLETKQDVIDNPLWKSAFYLHISVSFLVLLSGATQFSRWLLRQRPKLHRTIGKGYVVAILGVTAPTGLIMAFYANGGLGGKVAFIFQALFWWSLTFMAYRTIRQKKLKAHGKWMIRSYAMTLSAVTLRLFTYLLGVFYLPLEPEVAYMIFAWSSWLFNLTLAEVLIALGVVNFYFKR